jgi:hypothetical protein
MAMTGLYLATFHDFSKWLAPFEKGTVMVIAPDKKQTRVIIRFIHGLLDTPLLADMVARKTAEGIELKNGICIEVTTASFKSVRGYAVVSALVDEVAFLPTDESAADPDHSLLDAIRPAMASIPIAKLIIASSPYARRGVLWEAYQRHWGKNDAPVLVWQAATDVMNAAVPKATIAAAYDRDPVSAAAEWGAQFRSDLEAFVTAEVADAVIVKGRYELPPMAGTSYIMAVDPAGGSGGDGFGAAVAYFDGERAILAAVRERVPPFSPESAVQEFCELARSYGVTEVHGDRWAGSWPSERFSTHGINYIQLEKPKSDFYQRFLPLLNSGRVELLDDAKMRSQLLSLERRTARGGKDSIDHPSGANYHDDKINCCAIACVLAADGEDTMAVWRKLGVAATREMGLPVQGMPAQVAAPEPAEIPIVDPTTGQVIRWVPRNSLRPVSPERLREVLGDAG